MPEINYLSADVAISTMRERLELIAPVLEKAGENTALWRMLDTYRACYLEAIRQIEAGSSPRVVAIGGANVGLMASSTGRSEELLALTDVVGMLSGQRFRTGADHG